MIKPPRFPMKVKLASQFSAECRICSGLTRDSAGVGRLPVARCSQPYLITQLDYNEVNKAGRSAD